MTRDYTVFRIVIATVLEYEILENILMGKYNGPLLA